MPKARIESLLTSFPKLIPPHSQHTSIETSEVRYVYQPLEDLYILLITNKASNILQDIDTLHLFARVVSDLCRSAEEKEILKSAFELLGAFDEIVSLGYREKINLTQVRGILEMESHEEKIQEIIARVCLPILSLLTIDSCLDRIEQRIRSKRRAQETCETNGYGETRSTTKSSTGSPSAIKHGLWHDPQLWRLYCWLFKCRTVRCSKPCPPHRIPSPQVLETGFLQRQGYEARRDEEVKARRDGGFPRCRDGRTCTCRCLEQ